MRARVGTPPRAAAAFLLLALISCLEEKCITVVVVFETGCRSLDVTLEPGKSGNIFVLPGVID